jgi:hypothetical protein
MKGWVFLFGLLLLPGCLSAAQESEELIGKALEAAGITEQFKEISNSMQSGLRQRATEGVVLNDLSYEQLEKVVDDHYSADQIKAQVVARLARDFDLNRYALLLRILESPQVVSVQRRITVANTEESFDALQMFSNQARKQPLEASREALITELDNAMAGTELFTGSQALGMAALLGMLDVANHPKGESTLSEDMLLQQFYAQLQGVSRSTIKMTYAFALQDLNDDNLKMSIRVYKGTVVQWFLQAAINTMIEAMSEIRKEALADIRQQKQQSNDKV